jgi:hypothetical protein
MRFGPAGRGFSRSVALRLPLRPFCSVEVIRDGPRGVAALSLTQSAVVSNPLDTIWARRYRTLQCKGIAVYFLGLEGGVALKTRVAILEVPVSDRDFELLLRRASEAFKAGRPCLLKILRPAERAPVSAS